ncbi:hypothetical protein J6590_023735 [Homalodisca vitripennis]|nr:hypothetical protein J6590_023735 [Homalodisca vitripennis]
MENMKYFPSNVKNVEWNEVSAVVQKLNGKFEGGFFHLLTLGDTRYPCRRGAVGLPWPKDHQPPRPTRQSIHSPGCVIAATRPSPFNPPSTACVIYRHCHVALSRCSLHPPPPPPL